MSLKTESKALLAELKGLDERIRSKVGKDELEISKLKEAWGTTGSKLAAGGSKAIKELEKEQKTRSTRFARLPAKFE